ncbi:hypothetical protein ACP4OV_018788 [Aristida adscensionis]
MAAPPAPAATSHSHRSSSAAAAVRPRPRSPAGVGRLPRPSSRARDGSDPAAVFLAAKPEDGAAAASRTRPRSPPPAGSRRRRDDDDRDRRDAASPERKRIREGYSGYARRGSTESGALSGRTRPPAPPSAATGGGGGGGRGGGGGGADAHRRERDDAYSRAGAKTKEGERGKETARRSGSGSSRPNDPHRARPPAGPSAAAAAHHQTVASISILAMSRAADAERMPPPPPLADGVKTAVAAAIECRRRLDIQRKREEARRELDRMVKTVEFNDPFISPKDVLKP